MTVKASDINAAIKAKYSDEQWRVWFEVSQSTGAQSGRRADAVVMNIWPSKAYQLHVFEVKVSRADFKNEMADLTKWKAVGRFSDFFWLACPVGLVDVAEVPEEWGLMELTKGGLRIKKQAPARSPDELDRGFAASLLRAGRDLTEEHISRLADERAAAKIAHTQEMERKRFDQQIERAKAKADKLEAWKKDFEEMHGVSLNTHISPEQMSARIKFAANLELGRLKSTASQARALADLIEQL